MGPVGLAISVLLLAVAAFLGACLKSRYFRGVRDRHMFKGAALSAGPLVSVIIPARNEQADISGLLEGLLAQTYRNMEIIVVDDASEDATARIVGEYAARDSRLAIVSAGPLPPGWTGKCNACRTGTAVAQDEFLLYLDCDVRLDDPDVVGGLVSLAVEQSIDLLSLVPRQVLGSVLERLLLPPVYGIMALRFLPYGRINDPRDPKAAAVGQCLFFRRGAYLAVGGHEAVKGEIAEDVAFARLVKSAGMRLVLLDARDCLSVRMYKSLGEIWQGWTKHLYHSAMNGFLSFLGVEAVFAVVFIAPPVILIWAAVSLWLHPDWRALVVLVLALSMELWGHKERIRNFRAMKWPVAYELAFAPAMAFALVLLAASAVKHAIPGGLGWKGRRYSASELRA